MGSPDSNAPESWLWDAACAIRGPLDTPKFKDCVLPLIFLKGLSDVVEDEIDHLAQEFGNGKTTAKLVEKDHKLVRFYIPEKSRGPNIAKTTTGLGQYLTDAVRAVARENPRLSGVIDITNFNATAAGQRIVDDQRLVALVQVLNNPKYRLGLEDIEAALREYNGPDPYYEEVGWLGVDKNGAIGEADGERLDLS